MKKYLIYILIVAVVLLLLPNMGEEIEGLRDTLTHIMQNPITLQYIIYINVITITTITVIKLRKMKNEK